MDWLWKLIVWLCGYQGGKPKMPTPETPFEPPSLPGPDSVIAELLQLHNDLRRARSSPALIFNETLNLTAQQHAEWMAANRTLDHDEPDGNFAERIMRNGYVYRMAGENIARGQRTAKQAVESWLKSEGHARNIYLKDYWHAGFGAAQDSERTYWCVVFASPRGGKRLLEFPLHLPSGVEEIF